MLIKYTSQIDSTTQCFTGNRVVDRFYQKHGDCIQVNMIQHKALLKQRNECQR